MRHGSLLPIAVIFAALLAAAPARADEPPPMSDAARALLEAGMKRFEAADFDGAAAKFSEARALDPHRDLFYAEAQARRRGGHCEDAIPLYEAFLQAGPPEAEASLARANLTKCQSVDPGATTVPGEAGAPGEAATFTAPALAQPPPPAIEPATLAPFVPRPPPIAAHPRDDTPTPGPAFWQDGWFWGAAALGAAGAGTGLALLSASEGEATAANDATTLEAFVDAKSARGDLSAAGSVTVAIGGAFLAVALVRAVWLGTTPSRMSSTTPPRQASSLSFPFAL